MKKMLSFSLLLCALALTAACGDDNKGAEFNGVTPSSGVTVETGKQVFLNALAKNTTVSWTCPEEAACRPVGHFGLDFTAPPTPGEYTVKANANGKTETVPIKVIWSTPTIAISTSATTLTAEAPAPTATITVSFTHDSLPLDKFPSSATFKVNSSNPSWASVTASAACVEGVCTATLTPTDDDNGEGELPDNGVTVTVTAEASFIPEDGIKPRKLTATTREIKINKKPAKKPDTGDCEETYKTVTPDATVGGEQLVITTTGLMDKYSFVAGFATALWFEDGDGTVSFNIDVTTNTDGVAGDTIPAGEKIKVAELSNKYIQFDEFVLFLYFVDSTNPFSFFIDTEPDLSFDDFPGVKAP